MLVDWDPPLKHRKGSRDRLLGIDIYYDFPWDDLFPDRRAQFKNGQSLARLARKDCPPDKTPALLLTTRVDAEEGPRETDTHFFVVVNLPKYLREATSDAATSYFAREFSSPASGILHWRELARRPDVANAVFEEQLDIARIVTWAGEHEERLRQLQEIAGATEANGPIADPQAIIAALESLGKLDSDVIEALTSILGRNLDREQRLKLLKAVTADQSGRNDTGTVVVDRLPERLEDVREAAETLNRLLGSATSTETDFQKHIEDHPWLIGLDYVRVRHRHAIARGELDFILERYDGFHDLLELKDPHDPIISAPEAVDGVPPSASSYHLSPVLAQALAQVHVYREVLTDDATTIEKLYGLQQSRHPLLVIVIGQAKDLPPHRARVLRDLNLSLHRVEVVPYDVLADRAHNIVAHIEKYLTIAQGQTL